ncbi:MAG: 3-dehydroquinate synthase, partial [Gammaproteobacteria bacterium]|nr:3-dehydroquinate synthase [Gammaproteobacteria bacterium]
RSYPIHIGTGLLSDPALPATTCGDRRPVIVTDSNVAQLYLTKVAANFNVPEPDRLILPPGERHKTLASIELIYDFLLARHCDRQTILIALGGGVTGDMSGFAAACFQRGIDFIQIPTTLLSQVDSSVGGKTGVNHPLGKNMIGAFHQPKAVIIDTDTLTTLPTREIAAGIAEIIKYGLIQDEPFLSWLEQNLDELQGLNPDILGSAIAQSCINKATVVAADEKEQGLRAILNLGHTFGHAVETFTGYGQWLHGEAVGLGLRMAAALSVSIGTLSETENLRVNTLLSRANLPDKLPTGCDNQQLLQLMYSDKKAEAGKLTMITLNGLGQSIVNKKITDRQVLKVLEQFQPT